MEHKYSVGTEFETPGGHVKIVKKFTRIVNGTKKIMYDVKYINPNNPAHIPKNEKFLDNCRKL